MSRSRPALPYRVLPQDAVRATTPGWTVTAEGRVLGEVLDGEALPAWDAESVLRLERDFTFLSDPWDLLGLPRPEARLELVVLGWTGGNASREILFRETLPSSGPWEVHVAVSPPSDRLARDLLLVTGVVLAADVDGGPLAPRYAGARLWEATDRIRLEGGAARLPMYVVPFSQAFVGDEIDAAYYHVEVSGGPDLDLEAGLTVYLNAERPGFLSDVAQAGSPAERQLQRGIVRRVLLHAILSGAFDTPDTPDTPDERAEAGLAETIRRWARWVWPEIPPARLRDLVTNQYALCEARIDARLVRLEEHLGGDWGTA